ncbi:MAG TPA: biotin synthase [Sulfurovum sp.]|jgi:biotin synthase|nr:MAG: biotin synthase BioB [Sulfurovum sp. 35-42-20]OYY57417.1 MAG: biotin synthase BioB [Sulfurovum sp. 28-43-6]OYZ26419.1 MAG: biotin synthase BioB [Sulfurovum sp. 16-42-52]OYZ49812.1 MAG: biotin synthase BioB [Sulfurovum sp. 24-42-9]OZA46379.1 MAG: biotin synthase BioB [Sulfurovum sp. 17-42-90]OZA60173.1 MAG: biotin synthase BioB [Sulfurovum sp. 39-42-12]HQR73754.1 biotin synthase [Sulfurovum sp.]
MKQIFLCAINNVLSGTCQEDCKFCTQSVRYHANIERYNYKSIEQIVLEAKVAKSNGALGYCLVTAGKGLDDKKVDFVARAARAIKAEIEGLNLIACNGTANQEQLRYLKDHGIDSYNHNLETSERYYAEICTTHAWSERYETCENVKSVGLALCSGGIFGMGETAEDRDVLLSAIASLSPESTPLNFYHPNPALPIQTRNINLEEALTIIKKARTLLGEDKLLMVAGGRELLFNQNEALMFEAGANAMVIGNYLTTEGIDANADIRMLDSLGYTIATSCHE